MLTHTEIIKDLSWLGRVTIVWEVGDYQFAEYAERDVESGGLSDKIYYHGYKNGQKFARSYNSLESCMAGTMAMAYDGLNSQAGEMFERMLKL